MLLLVSGATATVGQHDCGVLVVPKQWNLVESLPLVPGRWAMDNGCFAGLDRAAFLRMLERFWSCTEGCLFVVAPDVLEDAAATLALWPFWSALIRGLGYPVAFVLQDGQTPATVPTEADAIFVGGSTAFKESAEAETLCGYAKARGQWLHMGRVNSKRRLRIAQRFGVDSYDGSGVNIAPDINIPKMIRFDGEIQAQPELGL